MTRRTRANIFLHLILIAIAALTLTPFAFVVNNSLRTNSEMNHAFFGLPASVKSMANVTWLKITGRGGQIDIPRDIAATPASPLSARDGDEGDAGVAAMDRGTYSAAMSPNWKSASTKPKPPRP